MIDDKRPVADSVDAIFQPGNNGIPDVGIRLAVASFAIPLHTQERPICQTLDRRLDDEATVVCESMAPQVNYVYTR